MDPIRISKDISDKEKAVVGTRKIKVQSCLQKFGINCTANKVPSIAILGSGGGLRAMIALQGVLGELQEQGLLDAAMYLSGVSGSTWCMSHIYEQEEWAEQLPLLEEDLCYKLTSTDWKFKTGLDALVEASKDSTFSLTDFWGSVVVYSLLHELDCHPLTVERDVSVQGKVPYPIYAAVDLSKLDDDTDDDPKTHPDIWFEFTPDEAGFIQPGAFVNTKLFGSVFENGKLMTMKDEKCTYYLRGLWGSALADFKTIEDFIRKIFGGQATEFRGQSVYCQAAAHMTLLLTYTIEEKSHESFEEHLTELTELLKDHDTSQTYNYCSFLKDNCGTLEKAELVTNILTLADTFYQEVEAQPQLCVPEEGELGSIWDIFRTLKKTVACLFEWKWGTISNYLYKYGGIDDKDLIGKEEMKLADAGLAINCAYPLVLRPERGVKFILCFDFSEGDPFETIKQAAAYCKKSQIPFPDIDASELDKDQDNPSDCYIFQGSNTPTVMHFPLFNKVNCRDQVDDWRKKYPSAKFYYEEQEIRDLLKVAKTNVINNAANILQMTKNIVQ